MRQRKKCIFKEESCNNGDKKNLESIELLLSDANK
jgi:hypothetical protein